MHLIPELAPVIDRPFESELFDAPDPPVEGCPRHHLGKGEVLPAAAHFPYPFVGLAPDALEVIEQRALECPGAVARSQSSPASRSEEHTSELQSLMRYSYAVF